LHVEEILSQPILNVKCLSQLYLVPPVFVHNHRVVTIHPEAKSVLRLGTFRNGHELGPVFFGKDFFLFLPINSFDKFSMIDISLLGILIQLLLHPLLNLKGARPVTARVLDHVEIPYPGLIK